jgi:hypothetical protein
MKWLVGLLVLANVTVFAYYNINMPKVEAVNQEIDPDKLKVLTEKDLASMPKRQETPAGPATVTAPATEVPTPAEPAKSVATASSCYKWTNLSASNLPSAQVELVKLGLQATTTQDNGVAQDKRFWVYYPPLKTLDLARKKADEIKKLGVDELYIVQDAQWRNAISFGLFNDEQLATNLLNSLHDKGVRGATKGMHSSGMSTLLIKDVSPTTALELYKVKPEFIGTELNPAACS